MKIRKKSYGDYNIIGSNVESLRKQQGIKQKDFIAKLQSMGLDINPTSYSKLEGQLRTATDKEVLVIAKALGVSTDFLFQNYQ
ncbi:MAG: helix-turn-helix transcriptional regulator [Clostridia bacterium]|nr:helix-turn-helix transcriptional regulator [Clostridia bacterium]